MKILIPKAINTFNFKNCEFIDATINIFKFERSDIIDKIISVSNYEKNYIINATCITINALNDEKKIIDKIINILNNSSNENQNSKEEEIQYYDNVLKIIENEFKQLKVLDFPTFISTISNQIFIRFKIALNNIQNLINN